MSAQIQHDPIAVTAARRGLKLHVEYAALALLVAVIVFSAYIGISRRVHAGFDCASRSYQTQLDACR
jgi:hypothetical protein